MDAIVTTMMTVQTKMIDPSRRIGNGETVARHVPMARLERAVGLSRAHLDTRPGARTFLSASPEERALVVIDQELPREIRKVPLACIGADKNSALHLTRKPVFETHKPAFLGFFA
jgi:hypothetical protein